MRFLCALALTLLSWPSFPSLQAQEPPQKEFFLPKGPVAAAYVLGRLTNKGLCEAPRSEPVYVALLQRKGLEHKYRVEALEGLAKIRNTDPLTELLAGLCELDRKGEASEAVLRDLVPVLLSSPAERLMAKRVELEKLAGAAQWETTRHIAYAALVTADGSVGRTWKEAATNPKQLTDLLLAIPLIRDEKLRTLFYPKVEPLLHRPEPTDVRHAAITVVTAISGHDTELFAALATLVKSGTERDAAVGSLQRIPRKSWVKESAGSLIESLVAYLRAVPVEKRTEAEAINAFQFATDLSTILPTEQASPIGKTLRALGVSVFIVRTIPEQMLYDKTLIVVEAGKPVSIVLINEDAMPHNLVVVRPGTLEEIGTAAEKMPPEADARGRFYVPASPNVLQATKIVEPGQQVQLSFTAPRKLGDYQYVCTFPGHWRRMVGTLVVVDDVEAYLATNAAPATPTMTEWKTADLAPALARLDSGRNVARGKDAFTKLACVSCHKLGTDGVSYGPELTGIFPRYQNNATEILRQIIEPSLVISNRYRSFDFELKNGDELAGMVMKEEGEFLTVQSGAAASLIKTIKKSDVKTQKPQKSSLMPSGLLNTLSTEEVLDLIAFLKAGGNVPAHVHEH